MKYIKLFEQFIAEEESISYDKLKDKKQFQDLGNDRYKVVLFAHDDYYNALALLDTQEKQIISYSLSGNSEIDKYHKLTEQYSFDQLVEDFDEFDEEE